MAGFEVSSLLGIAFKCNRYGNPESLGI